MEARELQDKLRDLIEEVMFARDDEDDPIAELAHHIDGVRQLCTYDDLGILTTDMGFVIQCEDGAEFQITIVRSK